MRAGFVSQEIYGAFGRYAISQLDRLEHNQRLAEHRAIVIGWLRDDPDLALDAASARLADEARIAAPTHADAIARARDYIKQLYRSMYDQGAIAGARRGVAPMARSRPGPVGRGRCTRTGGPP